MSVFKGTKAFYDYEVSDTLAYNVKHWIDYSLLEMGAYTPVTFTSSASGYSILERSYDNRYGADRVFEGIGPSWVWETDVNTIASGLSVPFQVSGVYVDNTFYPTSGTGLNQHIIDYENGRVIFTSGVASAAVVKCEYVARDVATYFVDDQEWKSIIDGYLSRFENLDELAPSGMASFLKENRVWLPSIFIETKDVTNKGLQLGGGEMQDFDVNYHVFSNIPFSTKRLVDFLNNQDGHTLNLINLNTVPNQFNYNGSVASGALSYKSMSDREGSYFWTYANIENSRGSFEGSVGDLYLGNCLHVVRVYRYLSTY